LIGGVTDEKALSLDKSNVLGFDDNPGSRVYDCGTTNRTTGVRGGVDMDNILLGYGVEGCTYCVAYKAKAY
jgi:hypothetical protein